MCVIIIKQEGKQLPKDVAKNSARINPHGLGIVWLDNFDVSYHKSSNYKILNTNRPFIAHFRYATVGVIGKSNTHPFVCGNKSDEYLMMNGTIKGLGDHKDCDSKILARGLGDVPRHKWKSELAKHECRFVTVNVRNRTYQVYNKELWTVRDGIWYSKSNVIEDNLVAVYGTLKKGYHNYWSYLAGANHLGKGETLNRYPLIINGLPYLIDNAGQGHFVEVDVFSVSDTKLAELDRLEGHPNWYQRRQTWVILNGKNVYCWIYFNIREKVKDDSVLHKSYVQNYAPHKNWREYEWVKPVYKAYKKETNTFIKEDYSAWIEPQTEDIEEFDVKNEKPMCIECYHDLEHDAFSNYHCSGCNAWFTETEVEAFNSSFRP